MEAVHKERLIEEAKQRAFGDILETAHQGTGNSADAVTLRDQILKVGIVEAGTLRGLIDQIFEVAVSNASSCQVLAELCQLLPAHFDPPEAPAPAADAPKEKGAGSRSSSEKRIDTRLIVLKKCKDELSKGEAAVKAVKQWDVKEHDKTVKLSADEKKLCQADRAARSRMLGAIHFCTCLYNTGLLTEKILQSCIDILLKNEVDPRQEDVECLCQLMASVGSKLEAPTHTAREAKVISTYFERMGKMKDNALSKDIVKRLDNVLTLRGKGWAA